MLGYVFSSSLKDFLRPGRVIVWGAVALFVGLMGKVWMQFGAPGNPQETYGFLADVIVYRLLALAAAVFSTMVISQEVDQKTIVYLLTRTVPRGTMLLGRAAAALVCVLVVAAMGALFGGLGVMGLETFTAVGWWRDFMVLALGGAAYMGLFVFVSLILNKAMIWTVLFAFGWETFVPNMPGDLFYVSIYTYMKALGGHPKPEVTRGILEAASGELGSKDVAPVVGGVVLVGIAVAFFALGMWWFNRFEFSPREDGD